MQIVCINGFFLMQCEHGVFLLHFLITSTPIAFCFLLFFGFFSCHAKNSFFSNSLYVGFLKYIATYAVDNNHILLFFWLYVS